MIRLNTSTRPIAPPHVSPPLPQDDWLPVPDALADAQQAIVAADAFAATTADALATPAPASATTTAPAPAPPKPKRKRLPKGAPITTEYTILIDSQEKHPFSFTGFRTNANEGNRPIIVQTESRYLGRGQGDYTLAEAATTDSNGNATWKVSIERKSLTDLFGTILCERDRFDRELANLNNMLFAAVIVEANWEDIVTFSQEHWIKENVPEQTRQARRKSVMKSIIAWQMPDRFPSVRWMFCGGKRGAETTAFLLLDRFWRKVLKAENEARN